MVGEAVQRNREGRVRQSFNHVAGLQHLSAIPIWRQPKRSQVMHVVADYKGIVIDFSDLVAYSGDIGESIAEKPRADPARVIQHPALFRIGSGSEEVGVVSQNATLRSVSKIQIHIREQERGSIVPREGAAVDCVQFLSS